MSAEKLKVSKAAENEDFIPTIIDSIQDIKGKNIVKLDLRKLDDRPTDYFIVCEADSSTQVKAIANNIKVRLKDEIGEAPIRSEGIEGAKWILVDYFDVIIHVFYRETREYYDLEDLWGDAEFTNYENID